MNQATRIAAARSTNPAATGPTLTPRRSRIGSAIASAMVSGILFGSVVMGMTSMADDAPQIVAQARVGTHA